MKKRLLMLLMLPLLAGSCSKDSEDATPSNQPKEYQVEYRVTAVGYTQARSIIYRDATGTQITDENVPLPKTYSFKATLKSKDLLSVGAFPPGGSAASSVTCTILLDGKQVGTKSDPGPDPQTVATYLLP